MIDPSLVVGIDLLCLDAGNTVIFLDHERLAELIREASSISIAPALLVKAEGEAKRLAETPSAMHDGDWKFRSKPGAAAWGRMVATIAICGGLDPSLATKLLDHAWVEHEKLNLWRKVPEGMVDALADIRARGVKTAIISNSEGMLDRLFRELGVLESFDLVVDSGIVGVEKPDPRIFQFAFDKLEVKPTRTLHIGDVFATDILGARAAGCRYGLIDPFGHYEGKHLDVPRVPGVVEVARAIDAARF